MMIDVEFFDDAGRWNPRKVLFSAARDEARAASLKVRLFGGIMRMHAVVWAKNYVKSKFGDHDPRVNALLTTIKQSSAISYTRFLPLLAERENYPGHTPNPALEGNPTGGAERKAFEPHLTNAVEVLRDQMRSFDWKCRDESCFKALNFPIAQRMAYFIDSLASHKENDELVKKIWGFVLRYEKWSEKKFEDSKRTDLQRRLRDAESLLLKIIIDSLNRYKPMPMPSMKLVVDLSKLQPPPAHTHRTPSANKADDTIDRQRLGRFMVEDYEINAYDLVQRLSIHEAHCIITWIKSIDPRSASQHQIRKITQFGAAFNKINAKSAFKNERELLYFFWDIIVPIQRAVEELRKNLAVPQADDDEANDKDFHAREKPEIKASLDNAKALLARLQSEQDSKDN
jgi:hypothetical protein